MNIVKYSHELRYSDVGLFREHLMRAQKLTFITRVKSKIAFIYPFTGGGAVQIWEFRQNEDFAKFS